MKNLLERSLVLLLAALPTLAQQNPPDEVSNSAQTQAVAHDGATQIVPSLKGLLFVAKAEDVNRNGVTNPGVDTTRVQMLGTGFQDRMSAYLDHPLTFADLDSITHEVVAYFRDHNHPLVDAIAPAQNATSGVIQILVTEFRVGEVRAQGNRWFSDRLVTAPITLRHGDIVDSQKLINQLDAANTNPFRRVNLVYQPDAEEGYTDLVLKTQDRLPLRVFAGFENSGSPSTGRNRWDLGLTWGNALWHDQQLSYQFSSSTNLFGGTDAAGNKRDLSFQGHSLTWSMPVRGRDSISIFGSYDRSAPNVGPDFGLIGVSGQASIRYNLALRRTGSLIHTLQFGYDFKSTNNNLQFGGTQVSRTNTEIDQFPIAYVANMTDKWGSTALTSSLFYSPGRFSPNNNSYAFQPEDGQSGRAMASAHYVYWRSDATRLTKLPTAAVWALRVLGQVSNGNLLYTEQLAGGGPEILRGYNPNSILGDQGVIISNELRTPTFGKTSGEGAQLWGKWQLLGFWDWANLHAVHDVDGTVNHLSASSTGVGLRYSLRSNVTAKMDYGWQLQHLPGVESGQHLLNFALMTSY